MQFHVGNLDIKCIERFGAEVKVSLYADYLILYISDLDTSVPAALTTLNTFGQLSGYKLKMSKSELFLVNASANWYPLHTALHYPFKFVVNGFTYLGIQATCKFKNLF